MQKAVGGYFQTLMSSASAAMPAALTAAKAGALQPAADSPLAQNLSRVLTMKRTKQQQGGVNESNYLPFQGAKTD